ncbi:hypothetical protein [Streptomyces regalis]|uniref:Uncharacterized protein n=1 Tax=Streptomyces regalis TaxID=68262 RepID=A0A124G7B5_9ACTN|nr:hypothetical protein [Streptomyces regalis]KUL22212.1 hypothetical protein ADL12_43105 [Streptomyces regalis]
MMIDADGWCWPIPGQDLDEFVSEFVAARPPLTESEIAGLRRIFRTMGDPPAPSLDTEAAS